MRYRISPITIICMAFVVAESILNNPYDSVQEWLVAKVLILPGIIIGLAFHEYSHAKVATLLGDNVPEQEGRVTINPVSHMDPLGMFCLLFFGFGWGKPVGINPGNFKKKRRDLFLVSIAGVVMNCIIALVFSFGIAVLYRHGGSFLTTKLGQIVYTVLLYVIQINIVLCVFNLIPCPPLDGFNVVTEIFNLRQTKFYLSANRYGYFVLLFMICFNITDYILEPCVSWMMTGMIGLFL